MIDIYPTFGQSYYTIDSKCRFYPRERGNLRKQQYDFKFNQMRDVSTVYRKRFVNIESGIWESRP